MCNNVNDYIRTIKCKDGDCLIFAIDIDCWDMETINTVLGDIQQQMPEVKMAAMPSDFVEHIIHVEKTPPPTVGTFVPGITTTTVYGNDDDYPMTPCNSWLNDL